MDFIDGIVAPNARRRRAISEYLNNPADVQGASISGRTDVKPYVAINDSNRELSADRANAARRALMAAVCRPRK